MTKRVEIYFQSDKNGRKVAYRWSRMQFRSFRMSLAEAELLVATGAAIELEGHPFRPTAAQIAAAAATIPAGPFADLEAKWTAAIASGAFDGGPVH